MADDATIGGAAQGAAAGAASGPMGAAIGGAIGLVGGLIGSSSAKKAAKAQAKMAARNAAIWGALKVPTIEEQSVILQNPELAGQYSPEQLQYMGDVSSSMDGVAANQATIDAQSQALEGISEVAKGGFSEGDKATAREVQRTVSQDAQARQKAILNSMANRGVLGSGMELAAQLQSNQQAAEQMSRGGEGLTQQAQSRALAALGQQGSLASQMRGQEFGEKSDVARARTAIDSFNSQNKQNIANTNVQEGNRAQAANLAARQELNNQRAATANAQQQHNKGLLQTNFQNRATVAAGQTGANTAVGNAQANAFNLAGQQQQNIFAGLASGAMQGYQNSQAAAERANAAAATAAERASAAAERQKDRDAGFQPHYGNGYADGGLVEDPYNPRTQYISAPTMETPLDMELPSQEGQPPLEVMPPANGQQLLQQQAPEVKQTPDIEDPNKQYNDAMDYRANARGRAGLLNTFLSALEGSGTGYKADKSVVSRIDADAEDQLNRYKYLLEQKRSAAKSKQEQEMHKSLMEKNALDIHKGKTEEVFNDAINKAGSDVSLASADAVIKKLKRIGMDLSEGSSMSEDKIKGMSVRQQSIAFPYLQDDIKAIADANKNKLDHEAKMAEIKATNEARKDAAKEKALEKADTEEIKADRKENIQIKQENRKERKKLDADYQTWDSLEKQIKDAIVKTKEYNSGAGPGTGVMASAKGLMGSLSPETQSLKTSLNKLSMDQLVKQFAGMSKAIDTPAERAAFEATVPTLGMDNELLQQELQTRLTAAQQAKKRIEEGRSKYDRTGQFITDEKIQSSESPRQTQSDTGPLGDETERNGKQYKWNPTAGKYQLIGQ